MPGEPAGTEIFQMPEKETEVLRAKNDREYRNVFLKDHRSFILKCAYRTLNRYVTESDDEWSVALLAFNEAIDDFQEGCGSFEGFAQLVIQRNLIDHYHREEKHRNETATDPSVIAGDLDGEEDPGALALAVQSSIASRSEENLTERLSDEIDALEKDLLIYEIDFFDLTSCSPKAGKTKSNCLSVIRVLRDEPELFAALRRTRSLPVKELTRKAGVHKKVLERHRKYIITAAEIVCGDYPLLKEYLPI